MNTNTDSVAKALFQTRKQVEIGFNTKIPSTVKRAKNITQRAVRRKLPMKAFIDPNGYRRIQFTGFPSNLHAILGTEVLNIPDEASMRNYRRSKPAPTITRRNYAGPSKVNRTSLLKNVLKRQQKKHNEMMSHPRAKNITPVRLQF